MSATMSMPRPAFLLVATVITWLVYSTAAVTTTGITDVHVVFSNHLDVGFDGIDPIPGFSRNVIDRYFHVYFPRAIETAANLTGTPYIWTTHCWLISLYLDCPPGMGFQCPSEEDQAKVVQAIEDGIITWHAFPFNSEMESMEPSLVAAGIDLCHSLSNRFELPQAQTLSQRDVPGTTRGLIPILNSRGVTGISIGVNKFSSPPAFPRASVWLDEATSTEVMLLYHPGDYGGINISDAVIVPGLSHVLIPCWNSDNAGPQMSDDVLVILEWIRLEFPNANVYASTFDNFMVQLSTVKSTLPVFTQESGDTWINGLATDPLKTAQFRALQRIRSDCIQSPACDSTSYAFHNFTRLLLKGGEHTWGGDVKEFLNESDPNGPYFAWSNGELAIARSNPLMINLSDTWFEQREWAITFALEALPSGHPVLVQAEAAFDELEIDSPPSTDGYFSHPLTGPVAFTTDQLSFFLCPHYGFIVNLTDVATGTQWSTWDRPLGGLIYQISSDADYAAFRSTYGYCDPLTVCRWAQQDFGKEGLDAQVPPPAESKVRPTVQGIYSQPNVVGLVVLVELAFDPMYSLEYGTPQSIWLQLNVTRTQIGVDVLTFNKTATRIPEALWFSFDPTRDVTKSPGWELNKLGATIRTDDIIRNGSQSLHAVWDGATVHNTASDGKDVVFRISSVDVALVSVAPFDSLSPFATIDPAIHTDQDALTFCLFNNNWGTNYPAYYPFDDADINARFRFIIEIQYIGIHHDTEPFPTPRVVEE